MADVVPEQGETKAKPSRIWLKWQGEPVEHGDWVIAEQRVAYELTVDVTGADAEEAVRLEAHQIQVSVGTLTPPTAVKKVDPASPGKVATWTVRVEPLSNHDFAAQPLRVCLAQQSGGAWEPVPGCEIELEVIPAAQAIWCRRLVWAVFAACITLLWPIAELKASTPIEYAYYGAFGAPIGLLADELRRVGKEKTHDGLWGRRPSLRNHAAFGVSLVVVVLLFVRFCVVTFDNQAAPMKVRWAGAQEDFARGATRTVMLLDPLAYFQRAIAPSESRPADGQSAEPQKKLPDKGPTERAKPCAEPAKPGAESAQPCAEPAKPRQCLSPVEDCPGESPLSVTPASLFRLSRTLRIVCRRDEWPGVADLSPSDLKAAELIDGKLFVEASKVDCSASEASAWLDVQTLFARPAPADGLRAFRSARARVLFNGPFRDLSTEHRKALGEGFALLDLVSVRRGHVELPVALHFAGASSAYAEARYITGSVDPEPAGVAAQPSATATPARTPPDAAAASLTRTQYEVAVVPVLAGTYRFNLDLGPVDSSHWGTLSCYPRGAQTVRVWLLPLTDSVVRRALVSTANDEVLSSWTLDPQTEEHGDRAPVVPVCLPQTDKTGTKVPTPDRGRLKAELVVPAFDNNADLPQLALPKELLPMELRVFSAAGNETRQLGRLTCNRTDDSVVTRMLSLEGEASLTSPTGINLEVHAYQEYSRKDPKDSELPKPEQCLGSKLAKPLSLFQGRRSILACLPLESSGCVPIAPAGKHRATIGYDLSPSHTLGRPPTAPGCILNSTGAKRASCDCKTTPAKRNLDDALIDEAVAIYNCVAATSEYCPCAP